MTSPLIHLLLITTSSLLSKIVVHGAESIGQEIDVGTPLSCPLWTYPSKNQSGEYQCECGDSLNGVVKCDPTTLKRSVLRCHCMTYNEIHNKTVVGYCLISCYFTRQLYLNLGTKMKTSELSNHTCNHHHIPNDIPIHRDGQMCGSCEPGYAPAIHSYLLVCVECSEYKYNWLKYIATAILPLTVVYFVIVLFRVSITTGAMNTYVMASQVIAAPVQLRIIGSKVNDLWTLNLFMSSYMIWNLDIFRSLFKPFCLHPKASTLHILALEYAIAIYPLLLVIITYVVANLHEHFIVVVRLWRPFYRVFAWFRREWNIRSSLIDAFATFIVLSYVKILNTSFDILTPVALYDLHGNRIPQLYLYYDGTVEYFGKDHLPYAILALFMSGVFNFLPLLLLCVYPCRYFHRCLTHFRLHSHVLSTFMDSFQGCFRTKPYDCRYFAGIYLGFRIFNLALFSLTTSNIYYFLGGAASLFLSVIIAVVQPYMNKVYVSLDVIFFALLCCFALGMPAFYYTELTDPGHDGKGWELLNVAVFAVLPLYGIGLLIYRLLPRRKTYNFVNKCIACICNHDYRNVEEDPLPRRLEHPDEYSPLV